MHIRRRVERYLHRTGTTPTRFGCDVLNDSRFVFDLRKGRQLRKKTRARIKAWLDRHEARR